LAYNATADPDYYDIPCKSFPDVVPHKRAAVVPRPVEGTLLISASDLSGFAFWGSPDMNPFALLQHVKPAANLGGHTLVFQGSFDLRLLSAASHSRQAEMLASQGQLQDALAEARAAVEMAPERMQGHLALAQVLAQAKQLPEARSEYQESIRLAEAEGTGYYRPQFHIARSGLAALGSAR
jgi:tetratricopeptide (TPR) repeat protein